MTKTTRSALAASFNLLASGSSWVLIPVDQPLIGPQLVFVHKRASILFGKINSGDLFDDDGGASRLAKMIHEIALNHGLIATNASTTCCPVVAEIAPRVLAPFVE